MKSNLLTIVMLCLMFSLNVAAQGTTYSGNLIFNTQSDLDSFPNHYINVTGNLYIQNSDITDLSSLANIQSVGGDILISGNNDLESIDGLNNLLAIGDDLTISSNASLVSISGFNSLTTISGYCNIQFNSSLATITGFMQLNTIQDYFRLYFNEQLNEISGFKSLSYLGDDVDIFRCSSIASFEMFSGVTSIAGSFSLDDNNVVTSLDGFENLTVVGDYLTLENLSKVENFDALSNLTSIGSGITIANNSALQNVNGLENISFVNSPTINIRFNKMLDSLTPLSFLSGQVRNLIIQSNDKITDFTAFSGITNIQYRLAISEKGISSLTGFENITYIGDDLEISSCDKLITTSALNNLTILGGDVTIRFNKKLTDISLLSNLTIATGDVEFLGNDQLADFTPLSNVTSVSGELYIRDNANTSLAGFENLTSVGSDLTILVNRNLENIEALSNLQSVGRRLRIISNNELISLNGLDSLINVANNVEIYDNEKLENINALVNLQNVGGSFSIYDNEALDECCILMNFINSTDIIGGSISIYDNSDNCQSVAIISNLCEDMDGDGVTIADGDCDDTNSLIYPGSIEICDGIDNDCNGLVDGDDPNLVGQAIWYADADNDGLGDPNESIEACEQPAGYVDNNLDNCTSTNNPDQADDDCDGVGNTCDLCPTGDDRQDSDGDGIPDCAEWEITGASADENCDVIDPDDVEWGTIDDLPTNFICGNNNHKILVCRVRERPNKPTRYRTKCVRKRRVNKILAKGGFLGPCEVVSCGEEGQGFRVDDKEEFAVEKTVTTPTIQLENEMMLYPNPAINEVSIVLRKTKSSAQVGTVSIVSSTGQVMKELGKTHLEDPIRMDISQMRKGIYFVIVKIENQELLVQRLVIME